MKKKKIFLIAIPIVILCLILILLLNRNQKNWIDNILKQNYEIYSLGCDGTTNVLNKEILEEIKKNWKYLSNNGPFLGDLNTCYKKIIIDYGNDIVDIEITSDNSIIIKENNSVDYYTYYTNARKLISYLNKYFI